MATKDLTIRETWGPARVLAPIVAVALAGAIGILAVQSPLAALALGGGILLAVAIVVSPDVATLAVVAILYSNAAAVAVKSHGFPAAGGYAFPVLLLAPLAYLLIVRRQPLVITPAFPWILGFFVVNIMATLFAVDPDAAFLELRSLLIEGVALYFLMTNVVRTSDLLRKVIWVVVIASAFLACLTIYQQATRTYYDTYGGFAQVGVRETLPGVSAAFQPDSQVRSGGPFETGGDNRYAQILLVVVPLALFLVMVERRLLLRLLAAVCLGLIVAAMVYTFSRGGAVGFVAVALLAVMLRFLRLRHFALIAVAITIVLISMPAYWARISTLGALPGAADTAAKTSPDGSIQSRGTENLAAVLIFADHPVVGVGPGLYPQYYREYADRLGDYSNQFDIKIKNADRQAHTLYLGLLAETGILGFVSFMGAVVVTLYYLNRIRRRCLAAGKTELTHLASSFMLAIFAYLITGAFLHLAYARYFFFVLALGACASTIAARAATEEDRNPDDAPSQLRFWARRPWSARRRRVRVGEPVRA